MNWERVGFPPLRLTLDQLQELVSAAGPDAELSRDGEVRVAPEELIAAERSWTSEAVIKTPEMKLELAGDHAWLSFDNRFAYEAEALVSQLSEQRSNMLAMLVPLILGALIFVPLRLSGMRLELVSLIALAGMLVGVVGVALMSRTSAPVSEPVDGDPHTWRTTFPCGAITLEQIGELTREIDVNAQLEFASGAKGPSVVVRARGIELTLTDGEGEVVFEDAGARAEEFFDQVQKHSRPLRWFTHDDLAIFVGMLLPIAAIVLAPDESQTVAALIAVVPWIAYLQWVLGNQRKRWSVITSSETTREA